MKSTKDDKSFIKKTKKEKEEDEKKDGKEKGRRLTLKGERSKEDHPGF